VVDGCLVGRGSAGYAGAKRTVRGVRGQASFAEMTPSKVQSHHKSQQKLCQRPQPF
jgi:hypothetical protein